MIRIEPLGTEVILPAFVVGYELADGRDRDDDAVVERLDSCPPWLLTLDQEAGGHGCRYASVVGLVLRLAIHRDRALRDPRSLLRAFAAMAEDPRMGVLRRDYPKIAPLVGTSGFPYSESELERLTAFVRGWFHVPRFESGFEAFVRCEPCDPLEYFAGWKAMSARVDPRRPPRELYRDQVATYLDESNLSEVERRDEHTLDANLLTRLLEVGAELPSRPHLGVYLLWENSD